MYFWRAKKERANSQDAAGPSAEFQADASAMLDDDLTSKVVTLAPSRLSDRLAKAGAEASKIIIDSEIVGDEPAQLPEVLVSEAIANLKSQFPGQKNALEALRSGISNRQAGFNVLVMGATGTGRRSAVRHLLEIESQRAQKSKDWVYFVDDSMTGSVKPVALPGGETQGFARACDLALAKSATALERLLASDDYAIGLQVLDEEFKQVSDNAFDVLKRRAESQNIALVKTPEGYVLAPMHEGRVVKSDVFRSLPEALQRDVEEKISGLETELKALIAEVPSREAGYGEKLALLNREVASRALHPHLNEVRAQYAGSDQAEAALDLLESTLIANAGVLRPLRRGSKTSAAFACHFVPLGGENAGSNTIPVVFAREAASSDFTGDIGHDASGRLSVRPGHLMRANGGYLIVEAWRLASMPGAWETLSAALESARAAPQATPGLVVDAEAVPLALKLIMIADEASWTRLKAVDPGIARHFPSRIKFVSDAPKSEVDESAFTKLADAIAEQQDLPALENGAARALYDDACRRSGSGSRVSLDINALSQCLAVASANANRAGVEKLRRSDIEDAISERTRSDFK